MKIYLRTRGELRHLDYGFLGVAPEKSWWRDFSGVTTMERPCVLCTEDQGSWRVFVSGVPSKRVDTVGTMIVYTIVLEGDASSSDTDRQLALRLIATWAEEIGTRREHSALTDGLDEAFPRATVEKYLMATSESANTASEEVSGQVRAVLGTLPVRTNSEPAGRDAAPDRPDRWIGGVANTHARAAFLEMTETILGGGTGQAHVLNMVADGAQARNIRAEHLAVLMVGEFVGDATAAITEIPSPKVPAEVTKTTEETVDGKHSCLVIKVAAAIIGLGILAWVIYKATSTGSPIPRKTPKP